MLCVGVPDLSSEQELKVFQSHSGEFMHSAAVATVQSTRTLPLGSWVEGVHVSPAQPGQHSEVLPPKAFLFERHFAFVSHGFAIVNTLYLSVDYSNIFC